MERWVLLRKGADFEAIGKKYQISPRLACLIRNRDVIGEEAIERYLNGTISDLYDGMLMKDADKAIDILKEKIAEEKKIRVIGDYDIDGVNATYILLEGLERLGAYVDSDIPDRIGDGYGLNRHLIDRAYDAGIDTIITCDNGIAAANEIAYGKELGMTIIVTDHHEIPFDEIDGEKIYRLPPADAVIDPKQKDCVYPFKGLCGAAVAYKLMEALWESMGKDSADLDDLIENVAIATVGDVMDLEDENRIFVKEGLQMLKRTKNPGLKALIECTGIDKESLNSYHIGFVLGPCINASGRLDTAKRALKLLRVRTQKEADILAGDLKALNDSRKDMTEEAVKLAKEQVETTDLSDDRVLVIYLPDCHESLAGLLSDGFGEGVGAPACVLHGFGTQFQLNLFEVAARGLDEVHAGDVDGGQGLEHLAERCGVAHLQDVVLLRLYAVAAQYVALQVARHVAHLQILVHVDAELFQFGHHFAFLFGYGDFAAAAVAFVDGYPHVYFVGRHFAFGIPRHYDVAGIGFGLLGRGGRGQHQQSGGHDKEFFHRFLSFLLDFYLMDAPLCRIP